MIATLQPDVNSFVDTVMDHKDHAVDMASAKEWATNCHQSAKIDTAYPLLSFLMSCGLPRPWTRRRRRSRRRTRRRLAPR